MTSDSLENRIGFDQDRRSAYTETFQPVQKKNRALYEFHPMNERVFPQPVRLTVTIAGDTYPVQRSITKAHSAQSLIIQSDVSIT